MQEKSTVAEAQETQTVTAALGEILGACGRLDLLADELLWRIRGKPGTPPTANSKDPPRAIDHRFVDDSSEAVQLLNKLEAALGEAVAEFDRTFGI